MSLRNNRVEVIYTKTDCAPIRMEFPDGTDPFVVMERTLRMMFPDANPNAPDPVFDKIIRDRNKTGALAQSVERRSVAPNVSGSNPLRPANEQSSGPLPVDRPDPPPADSAASVPEPRGVRSTSLIAFDKITVNGKRATQKRLIFAFVRANNRDFTRLELVHHTKYPVNVITARCKELLDEGHFQECAPRRCSRSGEFVTCLTVAAEQRIAA